MWGKGKYHCSALNNQLTIWKYGWWRGIRIRTVRFKVGRDHKDSLTGWEHNLYTVVCQKLCKVNNSMWADEGPDHTYIETDLLWNILEDGLRVKNPQAGHLSNNTWCDNDWELNQDNVTRKKINMRATVKKVGWTG